MKDKSRMGLTCLFNIMSVKHRSSRMYNCFEEIVFLSGSFPLSLRPTGSIVLSISSIVVFASVY